MKSFLNCIQCILLLAAGVMVGCGGGSSSGGSSGITLPEDQLRATAQNRPEFGSVNQGPRAQGGRTVDVARVSYGNGGAVTVRANLRGIDADPDRAGVQPAETEYAGSSRSDFEGSVTSGHESSSHTYNTAATIFGQVQNPADRAMRYVDSYDGSQHGDGWYDHGLSAEFFTTHDGSANYLTFGNWLYFARGTGEALARIATDRGGGDEVITYADFFANGGHYGLFVDGTEHTGDLPTTGSARYAGFTYGAGESSTLSAGWLLGRVRLTATFGGADNTQVEGTISDFAHYTALWESAVPLDSGATDPGWGTVYLQAATINNGQFEGDTSRRQNGPDMGNWGGQFFGNDENSLEPPMFGGTWGVADETNGVRMTGAFGTWKQ